MTFNENLYHYILFFLVLSIRIPASEKKKLFWPSVLYKQKCPIVLYLVGGILKAIDTKLCV